MGANGIIGDQDILPQRNVNPEVAGSNPASANLSLLNPKIIKKISLSLKTSIENDHRQTVKPKK